MGGLLSEAKDLLFGLLPRVGRSLAFARDDRGCCRPERSEGSPGWGYCQESGGPSLLLEMTRGMSSSFTAD